MIDRTHRPRVSRLPDRRTSRRSLVFGAAGAAVAGLGLHHVSPVAAQDATPGATPTAAVPSPAPYRFAVGDVEIVALSDGALVFPSPVFDAPPAQVLFADAPADEVEQALRESGRGGWLDDPGSASETLSLTPLVVDAGGRLVLIDTGVGGGMGMPGVGVLQVSLEAAGIAPEDIDTVFFTHAHADHVLGAIDAAGAAAFPNARYTMAKGEFEFWTSDEQLAQVFGNAEIAAQAGGGFQAVLPAVRDRLELIDEARAAEIVPGLRAHAAYGHTPGHAAVLIESAGEQLLVLGDALIHPLHVANPDWNFVADTLPAQTDLTRRGLLDLAADAGMLVHVYHAPFPGLGRVTAEGDRFAWEPVG